jgi:hypothetical protein
MEDCKPMSIPMVTNWNKLSASDSKLVDAMRYNQLIGSLMYLVNTRPNIYFVVNTLNQYMVEPRSVHCVGEKHVLRYIAGSVDYGLDYVRGDGVSLIGYIDSDWAGCAFDKMRTSRYCFGLGFMILLDLLSLLEQMSFFQVYISCKHPHDITYIQVRTSRICSTIQLVF